MKKIYNLIAFALVSAPILFSSCRGQDAFYKDLYEEANAMIYPQRAENFTVTSGYYRAILSFQKPVDPTVTRAKIYWNSGADSLEVDVKNPPIVDADTIRVSVPLSEDVYTFNLYTFDTQGNRSSVAEAAGTIYGDSYIETLSNRSPKSCTNIGNQLTIQWNTRVRDLQSSEVKYMSLSGEKVITVDIYDTFTVLEDYDSANPQAVQYRGVYNSPVCADLLYKPWEDIKISE